MQELVEMIKRTTVVHRMVGECEIEAKKFERASQFH